MSQINITIRNKKDLIKILEEIKNSSETIAANIGTYEAYISTRASLETLISALKNTK